MKRNAWPGSGPMRSSYPRVREDLYRPCRAGCARVWPNFDLCFDWPGKVGQALIFARLGLPRPSTVVFPSVADFHRRKGGGLPRPFVRKTNLGGQGEGVFKVQDTSDQRTALERLAEAERAGRGGFVQQALIDHGGRDLRVVPVGDGTVAYGRWAPPGESFLTHVSTGGRFLRPDRFEPGRFRPGL
ncbi:MAG: hypothetical protein KKB20_01050 [Proteobacteria bacterium]|nr:hypothetical protein [Pseudomonadota bacterium]